MKFFSDIKGRSRFLSRWPTPPPRENSGLKHKIEENLREWWGAYWWKQLQCSDQFTLFQSDGKRSLLTVLTSSFLLYRTMCTTARLKANGGPCQGASPISVGE